MIDVPHLLRASQLRQDTFEWIHRSYEDRFRFRSWLIYEINLRRIIGRVQERRIRQQDQHSTNSNYSFKALRDVLQY